MNKKTIRKLLDLSSFQYHHSTRTYYPLPWPILFFIIVVIHQLLVLNFTQFIYYFFSTYIFPNP